MVFLPYVYDLTLLPDLTDRLVLLQHGARSLQHTIVRWRTTHKRVLIQLQGCHDMMAAEAFRNHEVWIPRQWFSALPAGEYYWFEIEGLRVYTSNGHWLGTVVEIIHTGSNDVYVVRNGAQEILLPALQDVIQRIDVKRGEMHLSARDAMWLQDGSTHSDSLP